MAADVCDHRWWRRVWHSCVFANAEEGVRTSGTPKTDGYGSVEEVSMASDRQRWREAVEETALRLGGTTDERLKLEALVDGFLIKVWRGGGGKDMLEGTKFRTSLPGWPTTAGLRLRPGKSLVRR